MFFFLLFFSVQHIMQSRTITYRLSIFYPQRKTYILFIALVKEVKEKKYTPNTSQTKRILSRKKIYEKRFNDATKIKHKKT